MTPKILIVDDEHLARVRIRSYIEKRYPDFSLIEAEDGVEALEKIAETLPDIVFLDIDMPELSGFDVLKHLENRPFKIIFQTAYDQFAVKAFEENACDYLLKPFTDERLEAALTKAFSSSGHTEMLQKLDEHLEKQNLYLAKFVVDMGSRKKIVAEEETLYFWSEEHVTRIFLEKIDYTYNYSLNFLEEKLNPKKFLRIHRNCIVHIESIAEILRDGSGTAVRLKNGKELQVSRERNKQLKAFFKKI